jgi:hypothetical protein
MNRGLAKAALTAPQIAEESKRGEWQVVHIEVGARGSKNTIEMVRSLRLIGGLTVGGYTVDATTRTMIPPSSSLPSSHTDTATATPHVASTSTTTSTAASLTASMTLEKSREGEIAAGLIAGMVGRRLRPDDEHDAALLIRSLRPSLGFTYIPSVAGNGVDIDTLTANGGAVQVSLAFGDRITMVGDTAIKCVDDMIIAGIGTYLHIH